MEAAETRKRGKDFSWRGSAAPLPGSSCPNRFKPPPIKKANTRPVFGREFARQKFLGGNLKGNFSKFPLSRRRLFSFSFALALAFPHPRRNAGEAGTRIHELSKSHVEVVTACGAANILRPARLIKDIASALCLAGAPHWQFYASSPAHFITPGRTQRPSRITGRREAHLLPEKKHKSGV